MKAPRLMHRRMVLWPTLFGWLCLVTIFAAPLLTWFFYGESFLRLRERRPAEILVVEGWIDTPGITAAAQEFLKGGYSYVVATGGFSAERGNPGRWGSYSEVAAQELLKAGVAENRIIRAPAEFSETQRTFESASAVYAALAQDPRIQHPTQINVFTQGAHARRSRLVYERTLGSNFAVGVIAWEPPEYAGKHWWQSSERTKELIVETAGWFYELFFKSGRSGSGYKPVPLQNGDAPRPLSGVTLQAIRVA